MTETTHQRLLPQDQAGNPLKLQELLASETAPVSAHFKPTSWESNDVPIPVSRYTSREFHERETAKLWPKVWQFACREEQIAQIGDVYVYDIVNRSVLIVRGQDGQLRAFYNACLHRGRALRNASGHAAELRCPFHGFTWSLEGEFKSMPCAWDFAHLKPGDLKLPQLRLEAWAGFVFINFDDEAPSLREHLGVVPEHFAPYGLDRSCTLVHIQKRIPCNWKVGQEAFFESLHTRATHPQLLEFIGCVDSQYDVFDKHVSRMITPSGVASSHLDGITEAEVLRANLASSGRINAADVTKMELPEGGKARSMIGELSRARFSQASGRDLSHATVSELQDAILYCVFPNMQLWAGYFINLVYRFIPDGDQHESCLFDFRMLGRYPERQPCPPSPAVQFLDTNEGFDKAAGIGPLAVVFNQDMGNLPHMMRGLKSARDGVINLAHYQESRIRHHHRTLDEYLAR